MSFSEPCALAVDFGGTSIKMGVTAGERILATADRIPTAMFAGDPTPFVMELPIYHIPAWKNVIIHAWDRCKAFVQKAGTVIFVSSALIWFLSRDVYKRQA